MNHDDLSPAEQELAAGLDLISLRMFAPLTFPELDHDRAAAVIWESVRELCETSDPPVDIDPSVDTGDNPDRSTS